ncbi:MAG: uroporphyrinogen decarboxylase family protein [Candidatus Latescibacteria bacterium]|jgi:uroporphyrinogen decarboxylase|nr:uroporphyrinogen decarboxylase family protein [Candidatus Latescibacterota bacterium]
MTSRERIYAVLRGEIPDCVPCCPDISNMIPCRLTGKPFWDIYVYQDPPLWKAYIDAVKHFGIDGGFELYTFGDLYGDATDDPWVERIVHRWDDSRFATQRQNERTDEWGPRVTVYTADAPPARNILPGKLGLPDVPGDWEPIKGVREWPTGLELWRLMRKELGEHGILGMPSGGTTCILSSPEDVYAYADDPAPFFEKRDAIMARVTRRMETIADIDEKPDFLICGGSGSLIWQSPSIFRELSLPVLKHVTELAYDLGIPTHVHSCGPEKELVRFAVEETRLTVIDPLEPSPMGDCDLAELKRLYGDRIVLKGNLHTTIVMLHGSVDDVVAASRRAIDDAGGGGGFILSTGDQCGRDTPDENLRAMLETARSYGQY